MYMRKCILIKFFYFTQELRAHFRSISDEFRQLLGAVLSSKSSLKTQQESLEAIPIDSDDEENAESAHDWAESPSHQENAQDEGSSNDMQELEASPVPSGEDKYRESADLNPRKVLAEIENPPAAPETTLTKPQPTAPKEEVKSIFNEKMLKLFNVPKANVVTPPVAPEPKPNVDPYRESLH